jgi:hypothetical protein
MNATDKPKAFQAAMPGEGTIPTRVAAGLGLRPSPLNDWHFSRLAIVLARQSDLQHVLNQIESRERQHALVDLAAALGWPSDRILLIDEDQGKSTKTADWRIGYHRSVGRLRCARRLDQPKHTASNFSSRCILYFRPRPVKGYTNSPC